MEMQSGSESESSSCLARLFRNSIHSCMTMHSLLLLFPLLETHYTVCCYVMCICVGQITLYHWYCCFSTAKTE